MINTGEKFVEKLTGRYVDFSNDPKVLWFRGVLQSLDLDIGPIPGFPGVSVSFGQFLERFIFTEADILSQRRVEQSIRELNEKLKGVELDMKTLRNEVENYGRLFLRFCGATASQKNEGLRKAYTTQLSNFFDIKYSKEVNKQLYQALLFSLSVDHLGILEFSQDYLGEDPHKRFERSKHLRENILGGFQKRGLEEPLVTGIIQNLISKGLMSDVYHPTFGGGFYTLATTKLGKKLLAMLK